MIPCARSDDSGNAVGYFVDRHVREGRGRKAAFIDDEGTISYAELTVATSGFARGLMRAGIRREMRIALILLDSIAFPISFWGALRVGVIPVPVNTMLAAADVQFILRDCQAEAVVISAALMPTFGDALSAVPASRLLIASDGNLGKTDSHFIGFSDFIADEQIIPPVPAKADELAFLLYTSGSTGAPKGVRHLHGNLRATADTYGAKVLGITPQDVVFSAAKLFFAYGLGNSMTFPMSVGATAVLSSGRATPERVQVVLRRHRPSIFFGVPTLYAKLLHQVELGLGAGSDRLRRCVSAGEALPGRIGVQWASVTGVEILDGVGTTEMLHIFLSNRPAGVIHGSSGIAVPGYDLRLVDDAGIQVVGEGEGELHVRGHSMADGYWNRLVLTRGVVRGEWLMTGDRYARDANGVYRYNGRSDDMIKVGGIWVSPFEVESSLTSHGAIRAAAVVGYRDNDGLTKPRAFVVLHPNYKATAALIVDLQEFVKRQIGAWKYPRLIDVVDALPETANGKIQRFRLRSEPPHVDA
jgi:4-hydroxybenzoate-CoA ligase